MRSTNENFDVFNSRDDIHVYLVFTRKSKFSFHFILLRRFTVNQLTNNIKEDKEVIVTEYLDQDLRIKRNLFSVKVRDK